MRRTCPRFSKQGRSWTVRARPAKANDQMRMKRILYFADFVFYPMASIALVAAALLLKEPLTGIEAAFGFAGGLAFWTLAEYLIHRFALHGPAYLAALHEMH